MIFHVFRECWKWMKKKVGAWKSKIEKFNESLNFFQKRLIEGSLVFESKSTDEYNRKKQKNGGCANDCVCKRSCLRDSHSSSLLSSLFLTYHSGLNIGTATPLHVVFGDAFIGAHLSNMAHRCALWRNPIPADTSPLNPLGAAASVPIVLTALSVQRDFRTLL